MKMDPNAVLRAKGEDASRVELDAAAARGPYKPANGAVQVDDVAGEVRLDDFVAYMPEKAKYVCLPTGDLWPGTSVDAAVPPVDEGGKKPTPASKIGSPETGALSR